MYVVERVARGHRYLYLVESVREGKTVRQRTIKALGRKDALYSATIWVRGQRLSG